MNVSVKYEKMVLAFRYDFFCVIINFIVQQSAYLRITFYEMCKLKRYWCVNDQSIIVSL